VPVTEAPPAVSEAAGGAFCFSGGAQS
jgi:hypothetical protein